MNEYHNGPKPSGTLYMAVPMQEQDNPKEHAHKPPGWWHRIVFDSWIPEILAISCSAACLIAIAIVLLIFNDKPTPEMRYGITLNAIVSILATASRSSLIFTVASSVGQLKWCWYYRRKRRLYHVQIFDDASRGPLGSIQLLLSLGLRPLATIGAVVTILALAFDPFVQQVLSYPSRSALSQTASASVLKSRVFIEDISPAWESSLGAGVWSEAHRFAQRPDCPTGTCTWPPYSTVGWCAKCVDAMSIAKVRKCTPPMYPGSTSSPKAWLENNSEQCEIGFGHGSKYKFAHWGGLGGEPGYGRWGTVNLNTEFTWTLGGVEADGSTLISNTTYAGVRNPVVAFGSIELRKCHNHTKSDREVGLGWCLDSAKECALSLCEMTMTSSVTNGEAAFRVEKTNFGFMEQYGSSFRGVAVCWRPKESTYPLLGIPDTNISKEVSCLEGKSSLQSYQESLSGSLTGQRTINLPYPGSPGSSAWSSAAFQYVSKIGLNEALQRVAASLSSLALRTNGTATYEPYSRVRTNSPPIPVRGKAYEIKVFVHVSWPWLALPFTLVTTAIILLLLAAVQSRRCKVRLWKSSILPLLYHGLEPRAGPADGEQGFKSVSEIAEYAEGVEVQLASRPGKELAALVRERK